MATVFVVQHGAEPPLVRGRAAGAGFHLLPAARSRPIDSRLFRNLIPAAIGPFDGDRAVSDRAFGGAAHRTGSRVVCGVRLPIDARVQRSSGRCASVCAGHLPGRGQSLVPDPLAGRRPLVGCGAVYRVCGPGVARSLAILAVLYRDGAICSGETAPHGTRARMACRPCGIRHSRCGAAARGARRAASLSAGNVARHRRASHLPRPAHFTQVRPDLDLRSGAFVLATPVPMASGSRLVVDARNRPDRRLVADPAGLAVCRLAPDGQQHVRHPLSLHRAARRCPCRHACGCVFYSRRPLEADHDRVRRRSSPDAGPMAPRSGRCITARIGARRPILSISWPKNDPGLPVLCPSPFIEARPPVWQPDYALPGFLYCHLPVYPFRGKQYLLPFDDSPEAERYVTSLARGADSGVGTIRHLWRLGRGSLLAELVFGTA